MGLTQGLTRNSFQRACRSTSSHSVWTSMYSTLLSGPAALPVICWGQSALGDRLGCSWVARVSWGTYLKDAVKERGIFTGALGMEVIALMASSSTCATCLLTP